MINTLLVFTNELTEIEAFTEIIDKFSEKGYKVFYYENICDMDFRYTDLPEIINHYKNEYSNLHKIVIMSNIRDLLYFWFRCYNQIVDDFIYFVEKKEKNFFDVDDKFYSVYFNMFEFNGIKNETIDGSIYLTKKDNTILPLNYNPIYVQLFKYFKFDEKKVNTKIINKKYETDEYGFYFKNFETDKFETIKLDKLNRRILLFEGESRDDVLRVITDCCEEFYRELGFDVDRIDLTNINNNTLNNKLLKKDFDFAYSLNCIGINLENSECENIYDMLDKPFFGTLGDHPIYHENRIINSPKKTLFTCLDEENLVYFEENYPDKSIITNFKFAYKSKNYKTKNISDREIDLLFTGTIIDPASIKAGWDSLDPIEKDIVESISEKIINNHRMLNINHEIKQLCLEKGYELNKESISLIHEYIENYVRYYKRYKLISELGKSGLRVHCYGNRAEYSKLNISGNLIIHDDVDYSTLLDLYNNSKMVISITGHLYKGITERVTSAMINGAVSIAERDNFTSQHFIDNENIILYDLNHMDELITNIQMLLNDIPRLERIAFEGSKVARRYDFRTELPRIPRLLRNFDKDFNKDITVTKTFLPEIDKYKRYVNMIYDSGQITNNGNLVKRLEKRLEEYLGVKNLILVANGTLALQVAYKVLGLSGDVITTPFSFVATTSSLVWEGLTPVFVDIDKDTLNIDVNKIEDKITEKTSAIVPVHVYGNGCDVEKINEIASKHNLKVIYDAAHAFDITYKEQSILQQGDISMISFHATKIFHSIEGGALIINDDEMYKKAKKMINFGITGPDQVDCLGINTKMNEFQAAMGLCVLDEMDVIFSRRKAVYNTYKNHLPKHLTLPKHNEQCNYNYSYYPVIFPGEKELLRTKEILEKNNVFTRRYFYPSLDNLDYVITDKMPIAQDIASRVLCLPMSTELSEGDINKIIELLRQ